MPIESAGEVVFQGGPAGTDGQSTYQAWLALGNVGSIVDFIAAQRGAPGPANSLTVGTVSTGAPGSSASATITGQSPNQTLNLTVPQGAPGTQPWQTPPTPWAASTAYTATAPASSVTYSGESYVCATSHTSAQAFDASKWTKIAQKGADGAPVAGAVLYTGAQSLTSAQRQQAKQNIGTPNSGFRYRTDSTVLTAADNGKIIGVQAGGTTQTLPPISSMGAGDSITFVSFNCQITVALSGSDQMLLNGSLVSTVTIYPNQTVQLFTDGSYWVVSNYSVAFGSGLMVDAAQSLTDAQKSQLLTNAGLLIPQAQCRLVVVSPTELRLMPWNGNRLFVNSNYYTIPDAGIPIAPNASMMYGAGPNALMAIYALISGGALTLIGVSSSVSSAPQIVRPGYGYRIYDNGDVNTHYVGRVLLNASAQFQDTDTFRGVHSLYNSPRRTLSGVIAAPGSTASTAGVALGSPLQFVLAEPAGCSFRGAGNTSNDTAAKTCRTDITLDQVAAGYPSFGDGVAPVAPSFSGMIPAGAHAVNLFASVSGGTGSWNASLFGELG